MSVLSFLTRLADGTVALVDAITSSAGGADANKVIATGTDGKIDPSLLPPGVEIQVEAIICSEDIGAGDWINIYDNSGTRTCRKAVANDPDKRACGFALEAFLTGADADVYTKGVNTAVTGTEGLQYYLSNVTAGTASTTPPVRTLNHIQQVVGIGVGTGVLFEYDAPIHFK